MNSSTYQFIKEDSRTFSGTPLSYSDTPNHIHYFSKRFVLQVLV